MKCKKCGNVVPAEKRDCQSCGTDNGYPNVRLAETDDEVNALARRLHDAEVSVTARKCNDVWESFGIAVSKSKATISRPLATIQEIIESDRHTYTGYYRQLSSGARIAEENKFDRVRTQVEAALFPNFHHEIIFGFLSIGYSTLKGYGAYAMHLKEEMIAHRATVFEENLIALANRLRLLLSDPIPPGYRAVWSRRQDLAKVKLHSDLSGKTQPHEFPSILVKDTGGTGTSDFIEVHIFGPINRYTIEKVYGPKPLTREDRLILQKLDRQLKALGVPMEIV